MFLPEHPTLRMREQWEVELVALLLLRVVGEKAAVLGLFLWVLEKRYRCRALAGCGDLRTERRNDIHR